MIAKVIVTLTAVAGAVAVPAKSDGLQCWDQGGVQVSYSTLGNAVNSFCGGFKGNVESNQAPASGDVGNVHLEMVYTCAGNSGPLASATCKGVFSPIVNSCGLADGTTHGGESTSGCWTAIVFAQ